MQLNLYFNKFPDKSFDNNNNKKNLRILLLLLINYLNYSKYGENFNVCVYVSAADVGQSVAVSRSQ